MSFDFIHIGLGKCMSTTLQNLWSRSSNTIHENGGPIVKAVNGLVVEHRDALGALPAIDLERVARDAGPSVLSSEGLSFSFLNSPELAALIGPKHAYVAKVLTGTSDAVLVIVRDPVSWVRSAHAQSINQGGFQCGQDFVDVQREVILNNLQLRRLFGLWTAAGMKLVVLPMELFVEDEALFWSTYEQELGVPAPDNRVETLGIDRNASRPDRLALAAQINRLQHTLGMLIERGRAPDKVSLLTSLDNAQKWGSRRALPEASDQEIAALSAQLRLDGSEAFDEFQLDEAFVSALQVNFMEPLKEHSAVAPVLDGYRQSLAVFG